MAKVVSISELQPGMVILRITEQNGPVKIRKSGLVTSTEMVQGLAEMGVQQLEIDPELSVEIDAPAIPVKSQTQQLLTSNKVNPHDLDHALSDQFNRSLFLPSVQGLPSAWQHYGKQALQALVIVIGGGALGWTMATAEQWMAAFEAQPAVAVVTTQQPSVGQAANTPGPQKAADIPPAAPTATEPTEQITVSAEPLAQAFEPVTTIEQQTAEPAISPELLAKFNAAIEELDSEPVDEPSYQDDVRVHGDLPRVDQLPTRLMARLPSMSFSAHMYASVPNERWVTVNGQRHVEGDWIGDDLQLVTIEPQQVVMAFQGELFTMSALTDW